MALEHLIQVLRGEVDAEVAAIRTAAETEVAAIRSRTEADLATARAALEAELEAARQSAVELALAAARRTARRGILEARERFVTRVLTTARARFPDAVTAAEYLPALAGQLEEALGCLADRPGRLRCHPALHGELARLLGARPGIRLIPDPAAGSGFTLASEDGAVEIHATLEDRLTRLEHRIRQEVMTSLEARP